MSAAWWFQLSDGCAGPDFNLTYNLNAMLYEAGWRFDEGEHPPKTSLPNSRVWPTDVLRGARASDLGEKVAFVVENLRADPERFRAFDPPNGWGDYDGCLREMERFLQAIETYPDATIEVSF